MPAPARPHIHTYHTSCLDTCTGRRGHGAGASVSPSAQRISCLHERCVEVVMALVSQDESDPDLLAMYAQLALERGMASAGMWMEHNVEWESKRSCLQCMCVWRSSPGR